MYKAYTLTESVCLADYRTPIAIRHPATIKKSERAGLPSLTFRFGR